MTIVLLTYVSVLGMRDRNEPLKEVRMRLISQGGV